MNQNLKLPISKCGGLIVLSLAHSSRFDLLGWNGTLLFSIIYNHSNDMKLVGYSDSSHNFDIDDGRRYSNSSHNFDIDDGRSTNGHIFYLGTSPITWCSQKQTTMALSSCEAEFMAATVAVCQPIWLRELLAEVTGLER
ncbi:uncharacterized mitochondrial protein-like protein [Tanacetum coccineum]